MEVKIINITLKPEDKKPEQKHRLEEKVCEAACNCADVWLDPSMEACRALMRAMETLADYGDYDRVLDILTGLYDLEDVDMPRETAFIQDRPELLKLFIDEFLMQSNEVLDAFAAGSKDSADEDDEDDLEGYFEMDDLSD